jgi:hypothetical protein
MIIEAGSDLGMRLLPILRRRKDRKALWIVAMDEGLRELFIEVVAPEYKGSVAAHLGDLREVLAPHRERPSAKYFALAHGIRKLKVGDATPAVIDMDDQLVEESPELIDYRYLGRMVYDGNWLFCTWPQYDFRKYAEFEDLPRAVTYAGPHGADCECPACELMHSSPRRRRAAGVDE